MEGRAAADDITPPEPPLGKPTLSLHSPRDGGIAMNGRLALLWAVSWENLSKDDNLFLGSKNEIFYWPLEIGASFTTGSLRLDFSNLQGDIYDLKWEPPTVHFNRRPKITGMGRRVCSRKRCATIGDHDHPKGRRREAKHVEPEDV